MLRQSRSNRSFCLNVLQNYWSMIFASIYTANGDSDDRVDSASLLNLDSVDVQIKPLGWELYTLKNFSLKGHPIESFFAMDSIDLELMVHVNDF